MWLVRTDNQAYFYERAEGNRLYPDDKPPREAKESLDSQAYDKFFDSVSSWQQLPRVKPEDTPKGAIPGYQGILSLYSPANSRQMLLTNQDFAIYSQDFQSWKLGRFYEALQIIPRFRKSKWTSRLRV